MKENYYNCIYMYTNKINGKRYIGQTTNFNRRHREHIRASINENNKKEYNLPFHSAIRKYGIENFQIDILSKDINTQEERNELEISFILFFNTLSINNFGYNISNGGFTNNRLNKTDEEIKEWNKKIGDANRGEKNYWYGKKRPELSDKLSKKFKNRTFTEEHKQKIKDNHVGMKGKKHSEETKQKMSNKAKNMTDKCRQKIGNAHRGINNYNSCSVIGVKNNHVILLKCMVDGKEYGFTKGGISDCCKGRIKTHKGYQWWKIKDAPEDVIKKYIINNLQVPIN